MDKKLNIARIVKIRFQLHYYMSEKYEYELTSNKFICNGFYNEKSQESDPLVFHEIVSKLVQDIKVLNWKKDYTDPNILDGYGWVIKIYFENGNKFLSEGLNKKPPRFNKMVRLFEEIFK